MRKEGYYFVETKEGKVETYWDGQRWTLDFGTMVIKVYEEIEKPNKELKKKVSFFKRLFL